MKGTVYPPEWPSVFISEEKIAERLDELSRSIQQEYLSFSSHVDFVVVCGLKSSFIFFSEIVRRLSLSISYEFLQLSPSGTFVLDTCDTLNGKYVLLCLDQPEPGIFPFLSLIQTRQPLCVKSCVLISTREQARRFQLDYLAFQCEHEEKLGFGMTDSKGRYGGLPYIGIVEHDH